MIISNINNIIIDTITEISRDLTELFAFSFELRKADSDNKYSYEFLNGAVNPPIIVQIIMNNHWDSRKKRMIVGEANYRLVISINQQRYTLCYLRENTVRSRSPYHLCWRRAIRSRKTWALLADLLCVKEVFCSEKKIAISQLCSLSRLLKGKVLSLR